MYLTFVKMTAKIIAFIFGFTALFYIALLLLNNADEAPSAAALALQNMQQNIKPSTEQTAENNGYIYLQTQALSAQKQLSEPLANLLRLCPGSQCDEALTATTNLTELLAQHQDLSDWYLKLRSFSFWYEPVPQDSNSLPPFNGMLTAQKLLLVEAWLAARQQDMAAAQQLLQQDIQFWRTQLLRNNLLISKMVTANAIKQHFRFAAIIQQHLPSEQQQYLVPPSWLSPFTDNELSMLQVLSGEWAFSNNMEDSLFSNDATLNQIDTVDYLTVLVLKPLYKIQATRNERANLLLAAAQSGAQPEWAWYNWLYNPLGKLLNSTITPEFYQEYRQNLTKLEPLRQQAIVNLALQHAH